MNYGVHRGSSNIKVLRKPLNNFNYMFVNFFLFSLRFIRKADLLKEQICAARDINSVETLAYQQQLRV